MMLVMIPEAVWLKLPPLAAQAECRRVWLTFVGASSQPSLIPGPKIFEKLPFEMTFPK